MNLPLDTQFFLTIPTVEGLVSKLLVDNKNMARFVVLNRFISTDLKIDNLDRVSIPTKIVATFDVEHPILGTTYGV